jgi:aspartyl/asparaginyl beta-hydroxylase (cupin superfamily)
MVTKEKPEKPVYFIKEDKYTGSQPAFYQRAEFPAATLLEENWLVIKNEMLSGNMPSISSPIYNPNQAKGADKWKMVIFFNYLWRKKDNCNRYPQTYNILKQIDGLTFAALNLLEPHAEIKPHYGDTNTTIRCHLGIDIPSTLPLCGIKVNGEDRSWENGKVLMFSDAHRHSAWNNSDSKRYVFVVDIIRPEYYNQRKWICAGVLATLSLKVVNTKVDFMHLPFILYSPFFFFLRVGWRLKIMLDE